MSADATRPKVRLKPKEEKFAQLMATGDVAAWEAYRELYPEHEESTARTKGPEMFRRSHIIERVSEIQRKAADSVGITLTEWLQWHADVMRTGAGEVTPNHPLCQKVRRVFVNRGKGEDAEAVEIETVEMPSKTASTQELAKHFGWTTEKHEVKTTVAGLNELLASIVVKGLPREPDPVKTEVASLHAPPKPSPSGEPC